VKASKTEPKLAKKEKEAQTPEEETSRSKTA
jgi:hypothetical protein